MVSTVVIADRIQRFGWFVLLLLGACKRNNPPVILDAAPSEIDDVPRVLDVRAVSMCRALDTTWFTQAPSGTQDADAGDDLFPPIESMSLVAGHGAPWAYWSDVRDHQVHVAHGAGRETVAFGNTNRSDVTLVLGGAQREVPALVWGYDTVAGRLHTVRSGEHFTSACTQTETRDEALMVTATGTTQGILVAWDEDAPPPTHGSIKSQLVPVGTSGACGAVRTVSLPDQDASDPSVASTPDGGAVIFWLTSREVERLEHNDTFTDIWGVALDSSGQVHGTPVRMTASPGHRFGLSVAVSPDGGSVWLAYRSVRESGTEARGDGGQVVLARLTRNATGIARAGDPEVLTHASAFPTGVPRVFVRTGQRVAEVWWRERRQSTVVTLHRGIDATGRAEVTEGGAPEEPAMEGELPILRDATSTAAATMVRHGDSVGLARFDCR
jgi:hypothetical protein